MTVLLAQFPIVGALRRHQRERFPTCMLLSRLYIGTAVSAVELDPGTEAGTSIFSRVIQPATTSATASELA